MFGNTLIPQDLPLTLLATFLLAIFGGIVFILGAMMDKPRVMSAAIAWILMDTLVLAAYGCIHIAQGFSTFDYWFCMGLGIVMFWAFFCVYKDMIMDDVEHIIDWIKSTRKTSAN